MGHVYKMREFVTANSGNVLNIQAFNVKETERVHRIYTRRSDSKHNLGMKLWIRISDSINASATQYTTGSMDLKGFKYYGVGSPVELDGVKVYQFETSNLLLEKGKILEVIVYAEAPHALTSTSGYTVDSEGIPFLSPRTTRTSPSTTLLPYSIDYDLDQPLTMGTNNSTNYSSPIAMESEGLSKIDVRFGSAGYRTFNTTDALTQLAIDGWSLTPPSFSSKLSYGSSVYPMYTSEDERSFTASNDWIHAQSCLQLYGDGASTSIAGITRANGSYIEKTWNHPSGLYMFIFGGRPDSRFTGYEAFFSINNVVKAYAPSGGGMRAVKVNINKGDIVRIGEPDYNVFSVAGYYSLENNTPPEQPGDFIEQPLAKSINLTGETISLSWGASTDKEGDPLKYILEFYDGSSWREIASNLSALSYDYELPKLNITNAQFRIKAVDEKGGESEYRTSNVFTVRRYLSLIQDRNTIKTYKNGAWEKIN